MLNDAQFVISTKPYYDKGYSHVTLRDGWVLSYHPRFNVYYNTEKDILLLGIAWQTDENKKSPVEEIKKMKTIAREEIIDMEKSWCGRYVLIVDGRVYLDASGLLGVFYCDIGIASKCSFLAQIMDIAPKMYQPTDDLNWLPGPLTQYECVRRQLPSQVYNYKTREMESRQLLPDGIGEYLDDECRIDTFINSFTTSLRNMSLSVGDRKILIALTGGYDSRTLLALAHYADIHYECFTLEHEIMTIGDAETPQRLCDQLKCPYTYLSRKAEDYSKELVDEYRLHTDGLANDKDMIYYAHRQYQKLCEKFGKVVFLRSSVWENAVEYYRKFIGEEFNPEIIYDNYNAPNGTLVHDSLHEYFEWCKLNEQKGISDCNRFYWELREGCWLSSIEQGFDLIDDGISLQPANCRNLLSILMSFPKEERIVKEHQVKIIKTACPEISDIPFGSNKRLNGSQYAVWINRMHKLVVRLKTMGPVKTVKTYMRIYEVETESKRIKKRHD